MAQAGETLFRSIVAAKPKLVTGVPDGMLAQTIMLCTASPDFPYIACAREEECIGVASGAAMAGELRRDVAGRDAEAAQLHLSIEDRKSVV